MKQELYELTNPQKPIWLTEQYFTDTAVNTICGYTFITDTVNLEVLKKAIYEMVKSNDGMRLKINSKSDTALQYVSDFEPFYIPTVELSTKEDIEKKALEMASTPFMQPNEFLFQFLLFKLPDSSGGFIVNVHHLIGDSWSLGLIAKEVTTIYSELLTNTYEEKNFPSYLSYIEAEDSYKNSEKYLKDKAYWEEVFQTIPEIASLNLAKESKKDISCQGSREKFTLLEKDLMDIKTFCDTHKISVYNFFMAIYSLYVSRVSHLDDFVMGTPILNRTNFDQKHTMGMFISVVPLRITINQKQSFLDFAKKIATDTMSLFRHQKYSYQSILEDIRKRDNSIPNLYNVILSYQITKTTEESNHVHYSTDWVFNGCAADELQIHLFDLNEEAMTVAYDYKSDVFTSQEIANLHARILAMIKQIITNEVILLDEIEIVTPEEKHQILYDFNDTSVDYPRDKTLVDLFEEQVQKTPDATAVIFENQQLTYCELNEKANQLAHVLIKNGIQVGDIVAIYLNKSLEVVVSMFGILKAGASFLPLDIDYPEDRLHYIAENSTLKAVLSSHNLSCPLKLPIILVDLTEDFYQTQDANNLNITITPENLMYVMYTSGSTGNPKGVMVKHKNIIRLAAFPNFIEFSEHEVMVQTGTIVFDACIFEIFGALLHGFKLHILKKENILDIEFFSNFLEKEKITILFLTTGLFNQLGLQAPHMFQHLKYLLTGGDVISKESIQNILKACPNIKMINCYGPTENGSYSTVYPIQGNEKTIPIGKPITNSTAYVMANDHLCPIGVSGELWVGGDGIARGYLNNDSLTKEQFISNPFGEGFIYKTGDLVKWLPDGNIEFLGRIDNQVKVRGFRIELSEIDRKILLDTTIKQSLTIVQNIHNTKTICSYIVSDKEVNLSKLKSDLGKHLPVYMLPTFIMQLKEFPLNINGKMDLKAFPMPNMEDSQKEVIPARNELDKSLISALNKVLGISNVSIEDSFFDLGGDSLSAIAFANILAQNLKVTLTVNDIFKHPTICDLSDYIATLSQKQQKVTIAKAKESKYYPASSAQKRIYYASSVDGDSVLYNISGGLFINGTLEISLLQQCFETLIARHEVLRTHFDIVENEIVQMIEDTVPFTLSTETSVSDNLNTIYADFIKPFDLSKAPLFRAKAVTLKDNKILLLLDMHHIISDGTSLSILLQELCDLYNGKTLSEKQVDYKDFTLWEKKQFEKEEFKKAKDFWVNQYQDEIPLLNMPTTYTRPSTQSFEGSNYYAKLPKDILDRMNEVSKKLGITPYMLLLSAFYILLNKYTSQNDIVIGTPIVGRELPELSTMLGMFVNTLALRNKVDNSNRFCDFATNLKEYCLTAFEYQNYPFDELVKELKIKRDTSRNPLFDIMFIYQNNGYPTINFKDTHAEYIIPDNNISKFDLSLEVVPISSELSLRFEYCTKLFNEEFIQRLSSHYINILNAILENTNIKIADIDILSEEEKHQILYDFNDTTVVYPRDKNIVNLFEEQVEKTPNHIAVVFEDQKLTYQELNEKANQLARYLIKSGIRSDSIVGIMLPRSLEMIVSMFGILKAGAAYLPLDPTYPKNRIEYIVQDSNVSLLLVKNLTSQFKGVTTVDVSFVTSNIYNTLSRENLNISISPDSFAYVIYTSGSTGNPKGVSITHRNVNNFIKGTTDKIKFESVIVSVTTICFDIFVLESILPLQKGLTVIIANESEQTIPELLNKLCLKHQVTMIQTTPSKFSLLISDESSLDFLKNMKIVMLGGEAFPPNLLLKIKSLSKCKIYNMYGPTETTVWSSIKDLTNTNTITIGTPIANTTMYILDNNLNLLPTNMPGKLYIGGDGISSGYLHKLELTNDKFRTSPFDSSKKIYDTGDLAKWSNNGEIIYLGRSDFQVKIRGLRIELGEIEKVFLTFNGIEKIKVTANTDALGRQILCAYFVAKTRISVSELKQYLGMFLPNYMVPTYIMQIDDFQYTPNGKIDTKSLPEPNYASEKKQIILPKTDTECKLTNIWEDLLCVTPISTSDNFFEIGGDSLLALKMQMKLLKENINITYAEIFKYNTIHKLAMLIDKKSGNNIIDSNPYTNYDYSDINSILNHNSITNLNDISYHPLGNVLLTGVTGFLGSHILDYLMRHTDIQVYCLVRKDPSISLVDKVLNKLHFYFGNQYDELINKRIFIINSDLTQSKLGLTDEKIQFLVEHVSCVINSAAIVKHYGDYKDFENINVMTVKHLINFCEKYHKRLVQISTISVSGNTLSDFAADTNHFSSDIEFRESNLYIGQSMENVYVRSKFEAERLILERINTNQLDALILRIGNITNRFSDGKFQINSSENAFANKIKAFIEIAALPDYVLDKYIELSPVDYVAKAIIKSIEYSNSNLSVLHIYNQNHVFLKDFINLLPPKYKIDIVSDLDFQELINTLLKNDDKKYIISYILNDLNKENKLVYDTPIKIKNDFSQSFLDQIGFKWPTITQKYIENLLKNI